MDTKKFKTDPSGTGNSTAKGGRNNTKIILTAAGSVAAGMAAGAAASQIFSGTSPEPNPPSEPQKEDIAQKEEMGKEEVAGQSVNETTQATDGKTQPTGEDISQPQPTTGNNQPTTGNSHPTEPSSGNAHPSSDGETPQEVAEAIVGKEEIDKNDRDAPSILEMKEFTTVYNADGTEVQAVVGITPDGTQYLLADADGDGVYEGVYDMAGNFVVNAEANLTHSDIEIMMDQSGGYLALTETDRTNETEDPTEDILDTETGDHLEVAQNKPGTQHEEQTGEQQVAQDELSSDEFDNLLAELLGTDSEPKEVDDEVLVETEEQLDEEDDDDFEDSEDFDDEIDSDEDISTDDF